MYKFAQGICVFALAAIGLCAQTAPIAPTQVTVTSGIVGIAEGQTAQLNALNPGVAPPAMGEICSGLLTFLDNSGKVLKSKTVGVAPGTSQSLVIGPGSGAVVLDSIAVPAPIRVRMTLTDTVNNAIQNAIVRVFTDPGTGEAPVELGRAITDSNGNYEIDLAPPAQ